MNRYKWLYVVLIGVMLAAILPMSMAEVQAQDPCPDDNNVWNPGMTAQITGNKDVFNSPSPNSGVVASLRTGDVVTIVGNYQCANWGTSWTRWQNIQTTSGVTGWIAEKQFGRSSSLRTYSGSVTSQLSPGGQPGSSPSGSGGGSVCPDSPNQWSVGMQAQLTERKDLQVSTDYNAPVIERVARGAVVTIVGNYQCTSWGNAPIRWQYVHTASGNEGWIAEQQQGRNSRFTYYGGSSSAQAQQSQPANSAPAQQSQPAVVVDGCTDHPEQIYAGESSPPGGDYLRVNVANLRVRIGPSTSWCMNGYAVQGRYYPVHEVRDGWALITGTYGAGWLATSYVTLYGNYAARNTAPEPRNPLNQIDLGPSCTAVGSAQLNGPTAVANCLSSALDERLTQEDILNGAQILWDCGAVQTVNFVSFLVALQAGIDPASAALEAFDSQSTSDCANDLIELFGG